jgi:hypothetical protein
MGLQYSIHEVCNLQFNTFADNKPFLYADYAQISTNDVSATTDNLVGGQGNYTLDVHSHTKKSDMKITLPVIDLKFLAMMAGDDLAANVSNAFNREVLTVANGKVTLAQTPIDGTLFVNELQGIRDIGEEYSKVESAPTGQEYSITGKDLTFDSTENGKKVVVFYQYAAPTGAQTVSITANKFPKAFTIYADGIWNDMETQTNKAVKIIVYKAIPQSNFSITMDSTKYSDLQLTFDLMAIKDNTTGDLKYIDYIVLP